MVQALEEKVDNVQDQKEYQQRAMGPIRKDTKEMLVIKNSNEDCLW